MCGNGFLPATYYFWHKRKCRVLSCSNEKLEPVPAVPEAMSCSSPRISLAFGAASFGFLKMLQCPALLHGFTACSLFVPRVDHIWTVASASARCFIRSDIGTRCVYTAPTACSYDGCGNPVAASYTPLLTSHRARMRSSHPYDVTSILLMQPLQ